jgi:hypothetical protein
MYLETAAPEIPPSLDNYAPPVPSTAGLRISFNGLMQLWAKHGTKREVEPISKTSSNAVRRESLLWVYMNLPPVPLPSIQQSVEDKKIQF